MVVDAELSQVGRIEAVCALVRIADALRRAVRNGVVQSPVVVLNANVVRAEGDHASAAVLVNTKRSNGNQVHSRLRRQKGVVDREVAVAVVRVAACVDRVLADAADGFRPSKSRRAVSRRVGDVVARAAVDAGVGVVKSASGAADQGPHGGLWLLIWFVVRAGIGERRTSS